MAATISAGTAAAGTCAVTAVGGGTVTASFAGGVLTIANAAVATGMIVTGKTTATASVPTTASVAATGGAGRNVLLVTSTNIDTFQWQQLTAGVWANITGTVFATTTNDQLTTGAGFAAVTVGTTFSLRCICSKTGSNTVITNVGILTIT